MGVRPEKKSWIASAQATEERVDASLVAPPSVTRSTLFFLDANRKMVIIWREQQVKLVKDLDEGGSTRYIDFDTLFRSEWVKELRR